MEGFLDLDYRPSRAQLLLGAAWAVGATVATRDLAHEHQAQAHAVLVVLLFDANGLVEVHAHHRGGGQDAVIELTAFTICAGAGLSLAAAVIRAGSTSRGSAIRLAADARCPGTGRAA